MITLVRARSVLSPGATSAREILIADGRIAAVGNGLDAGGNLPVEVLDFPDLDAVPGFIDQHVHITGGGGEGGFATRCPELRLEEAVAAGVTTVVGLVGTDSISRSPGALLATARGLQQQGLSAYIYTGAYRVPLPTFTGDVQRDLAWIPDVIGVGELAISDHRSGQPRQDEIERIVSEARIGGMLAGKRGICHFHVGSGPRGLEPLRRLVQETEIPVDQVIPTHVNRDRRLLEEAAAFARDLGGTVDLTTFAFPSENAVSAVDAVAFLLDEGVPLERITLSSDANGSLPVFDERGAYAGMRVASMSALLDDWRALAGGELGVSRALELVTRNVARALGLTGRKGALVEGADADVLLVDDALAPTALFARGRRLL